jgi:hypothetical protein
MQRTRLNTLASQTTLRFRQWVFNPWRRLAVIVISLLIGNFFATAISVTSGQRSSLDVLVATVLVAAVEAVSWLYYRFAPRRQAEDNLLGSNLPSGMDAGFDAGPMRSRSTLTESLNAFKLGMTYGLFVEAFKLGS